MFKRILCFIGIHNYKLDNSGIEEFQAVSLFRCNACTRYLLVFDSEYAKNINSTETILEQKFKYDLIQKRNVLTEKC